MIIVYARTYNHGLTLIEENGLDRNHVRVLTPCSDKAKWFGWEMRHVSRVIGCSRLQLGVIQSVITGGAIPPMHDNNDTTLLERLWVALDYATERSCTFDDAAITRMAAIIPSDVVIQAVKDRPDFSSDLLNKLHIAKEWSMIGTTSFRGVLLPTSIDKFICCSITYDGDGETEMWYATYLMLSPSYDSPSAIPFTNIAEAYRWCDTRLSENGWLLAGYRHDR